MNTSGIASSLKDKVGLVCDISGASFSIHFNSACWSAGLVARLVAVSLANTKRLRVRCNDETFHFEAGSIF
jgi:hypothetical protein